MQPQQQPAQQPYYGYPQQPMAPAQPMMITKKLVFVVVGLGGLLGWISLLALAAFDVNDPGAVDLFQALGITGGFLGFGGSLLGALGSTRTDGNQNLGLLVLAGLFVLALAWQF